MSVSKIDSASSSSSSLSSSSSSSSSSPLSLAFGVVLGAVSLGVALGVYVLSRKRQSVAHSHSGELNGDGWDELQDRQKRIILSFYRSYRKWYASFKATSDVSGSSNKSSLEAASDAELISHLKQAHANAMKVFPYRCVRQMRFALPRISAHPVYPNLFRSSTSAPLESPCNIDQSFTSIELPSSLPVSSHVFVDLGCCFGTDSRCVLVSGQLKPSQVFCLDVTRGFFDLGCSLFDDADVLAERFHFCNILDDDCWDTLSLKPLYKKVTIMYSGSVYHLFTHEETVQMTANVFDTLADQGIFFGRTVGSGGDKPLELGGKDSKRQLKYLHTKQSLKRMLEEAGFRKVVVEQEDVNQAYLENMLVTKGVTMLAFAVQK